VKWWRLERYNALVLGIKGLGKGGRGRYTDSLIEVGKANFLSSLSFLSSNFIPHLL
jgi:hypothetical protein